MPQVNKCLNCDTILEEGDINVHTTHDPLCTGDSPSEDDWSCGLCGSDEIEEVWTCMNSNCNSEVDEGSDYCKKCDDRVEYLESVIASPVVRPELKVRAEAMLKAL